MPELPEVETVCRGLSTTIIGHKLTDVKLMRPNLRIAFPNNFATKITGQIITEIKRRAKYIQIYLEQKQVIIMHLGMTGRVVVYPQQQQSFLKHDHAIFTFENNMQMIFNDARRFGLITLSDIDQLETHPLFKSLGPEPLEEQFNTKYLKEKFAKKNTPVKLAIMDNNIVV